MVKVKICGISNYEDAAMAAHLGVDAIGFIFAPSPRRIRPEKALEIIRAIPPFVKTVGVFVNERPDTVRRIMAFCGLDLIQFHGDELPEVCGDFMPRTIKAFRVRDRLDMGSITRYKGKTRFILLDTYARGKRGGTGKTFDWNLAVRSKDMGLPVILTGGLNPANIVDAISTVDPYAVDINSGIEARPGKKDHSLMEELMRNIRKADLG